MDRDTIEKLDRFATDLYSHHRASLYGASLHGDRECDCSQESTRAFTVPVTRQCRDSGCCAAWVPTLSVCQRSTKIMAANAASGMQLWGITHHQHAQRFLPCSANDHADVLEQGDEREQLRESDRCRFGSAVDAWSGWASQKLFEIFTTSS